MIKRCVEQILNLYNFIDGIMVADEEGNIEYYQTFRPDLNDLKMEKIIGKNLFDIYPTLTKENSTIHKVLKTGEPIFNQIQEIPTYTGKVIRSLNTTLPLKEGEKIVGAVDVSRYIDTPYARKNIALTFKNAQKNDLYTVDDIISNSAQMAEMKEKIIRIANTDSSVLIWGESGTGKELVAQSLHTASNRKNKKFVSQNCAAIPSTLLESILFGTTKGSFTGAENKKGLLEAADGGTMFLDEINTLDFNLQAKLLKAIENGTIMRVGGSEEIQVNVRIIAATNKDLFEMVQAGAFRDDLYYRLKVVQIDLPELSERSGDIQALTAYFIKQYNKIFGKNILGLSKEAEVFFQNYPWHGNVRELKNTIEGCFNFASGPVIKLEDISWYEPPHKEAPTPILKGTLKETVKAYEKDLITETLHECGNISKAAEKLGLTRQNLNNKMKEYQLDPQSILLV